MSPNASRVWASAEVEGRAGRAGERASAIGRAEHAGDARGRPCPPPTSAGLRSVTGTSATAPPGWTTVSVTVWPAVRDERVDEALAALEVVEPLAVDRHDAVRRRGDRAVADADQADRRGRRSRLRRSGTRARRSGRAPRRCAVKITTRQERRSSRRRRRRMISLIGSRARTNERGSSDSPSSPSSRTKPPIGSQFSV